MPGPPAVQTLEADIAGLCRGGLDSRTLRTRLLQRLQRLIPFDSAWFASADPATLLFTDAIREEIPYQATPRFIEDEFLLDDVNKWVDLARRPDHTNTLLAATGGKLQASYRFREILEPLGLGDELRAALVARRTCWGFICLHRELTDRGFTAMEARWLAQVAPTMAEGLRAALLVEAATRPGSDEVGVVVLTNDLSVVSLSPHAERWLAEVADDDWPAMTELPAVVLGVAARLRMLETGQTGPLPMARLRTRSGLWLSVRATKLNGPRGDGQTAVIIEPAHPTELAGVIMRAYGLTKREEQLTRLLLHGLSTREVATQLCIAETTVQQHLKAIFEKTGVRSRRELAAQLFAQQYQPWMRAGRPIASDGWFAES